MCQLAVNTAFQTNFPVKVSDIEVHEPKALSTYHLLKQMKRKFPQHDFFFVLGSDLLDSIHTWTADGVEDAGQKLVAENQFIVAQRPGYEIREDLASNFIVLRHSAALQQISSTEVRARFALESSATAVLPQKKFNFSAGVKKKSTIPEESDFLRTEGLVPPAVLAHIIRYNLYDK